MRVLRSVIVGFMVVGLAGAGCAERPGQKKEDKEESKAKEGGKDDEKADEKKADAKD